ncbi:MAG TPA: cytochrome c3 family protein [Candidatus Methylacidiphilales bacterium]|nr:cytochrome c3 family protein [Candidatus Methylacidiphilales bacterium]
MANIFPKATNLIVIKAMFASSIIGGLATVAVWYYFTPKYSRVGYQPVQPVAFDHSLHVGQLGIDCRFCHSYVEVSGQSNYPATQVCMSCHTQIQANNPKLQPVRDSWATGQPISWVKIHNVPDYAYFNHSAHVNRGISCVSCHGQINEMQVVSEQKPLSMGWCLSCHRNPENYVRPIAADTPGETSPVFNLDWQPPAGTTQAELGRKLVHDWKIDPPTNCAGCHR